MKILHVNCNYLHTALHQTMVENLNKYNVESYIFAPTYYNENQITVKPNDNVFVSQCFKRIDRVCFSYKQMKIIKSLERNINVANFNCIHAYTLFTDGNCAMRLAKKYNKPYIVAIRDTDVNAFFKYRPHLRHRGIEIMRRASAVLFLSETYRQLVFDKYVPNRYYQEIFDKSYIFPNGVHDFWLDHKLDHDRKLSLDRIASKKIKLIFAGRICSNKNPLVTVEAIEILKSKGYDIEFTVIGKIEDQSIYNQLIKSPFVRYMPAMQKEKLIEEYRANDIFVMPSARETFGLVYVEALSQGLPVIYSEGQGFDGQFPEGHVGYHVDCNSAIEIANAIEKILDNYDSIRKNGLEECEKFRWDKICQRYRDFYDLIVDAKK